MAPAKSGDTVKVHYTGTLVNGDTFDSSRDREPLEFTIGENKLITDFEENVIGMNIGDTKTINIPAARAYGERNKEMVIEVPKNEFPPDIKPQKGMRLEVRQPNGQAVPIVITEVTETSVIIDANHPLAGENLTFVIELVAIVG